MRYFYILILLSSCAQRLVVPINRLNSPEATGGGGELEMRQFGASEGRLDFSDATPDAPLLMRQSTLKGMGAVIGTLDFLDIYWQMPDKSASLIGVKGQVFGTSERAGGEGHKVSVSFAMGGENDIFEGDYEITTESSTYDLSVIHGYRLSPSVLFYDGISYTKYGFKGDIKARDELNGEQIDYQANHILGIHGGVIGFSEPFKLKLEYAAQRIEWTNTEVKFFHSFGFAFGLYF
jgi:hypothetical protein